MSSRRRGWPQSVAFNMKHFYIVPLLMLSAKAWSCSCSGIESVDATIARLPILVEARVVSLEVVNSPQYGRQVHSVTLQVQQTLKGSLSSKNITVTHWMCYVTLGLEMMELQHTYVLPLQASENGRYQLAHCAHSGMELVEGKLYTFEGGGGAQRRQRFYKNYSDLQRQFQK